MIFKGIFAKNIRIYFHLLHRRGLFTRLRMYTRVEAHARVLAKRISIDFAREDCYSVIRGEKRKFFAGRKGYTDAYRRGLFRQC